MKLESSTLIRAPSVAELSTSNTCAVIMVDRRWATAALVHTDPLGSLYPFQWGTAVTAEAAGGSTPALMSDVVTRAWRDMASKAPVMYDRCLVCVAPSLTKSRDAVSRIAIEPIRDATSPVPRVTAEHLSILKDTICTQNVSGSSTVTEIVVHGYRDNSGHELPDPLNAVTTSLEMRAHLVMTDQTVLTAIMDAMRRMRVRVHAAVSPCAAAVANAPMKGSANAFVSIEVSESDIVGALVCEGRIVRTMHVDMGSADVVRAAARRVGTQSRTLAEWIRNHQDLMMHGADETPLETARPPGHPPPATLKELNEAGAEATDRVAGAVRDAIRRAMPPATTWPVVVTGDDRFACRAIALTLRDKTGLNASLHTPDRIHGLDMVSAPGITRMAGTVRYWKNNETATNAALDAYYERHSPAITQTFRRARREANNWCRVQGTRWRNANPVRRIVRTLQSLLF